jgi:two-component system response regulator RegX3
MNGNILIIEDVADLADVTSRYLAREGFTVKTVECAEDAFTLLAEWKADLIVLDLNLPGMDGFQFLEKYRKEYNTPILIVSARTSEDDQISGLSGGADEYITKPFSPRILTARVRAMFRRMEGIKAAQEHEGHRVFRFGRWTLDTEVCELKKEDTVVTLTSKEYAVLVFLAENAGRPFTPEAIYHAVWQGLYGDLVTVPVHIQRLRKKIEEDPSNPLYLQTVRGFGYKLALDTKPGG